MVPAFAVTASPETLIVPTRATPQNARGTRKDVRVTVMNHAKGAAHGEVDARTAPGLARDAGHAAGQLLARRRSDDGALPASTCRRRRCWCRPRRSRAASSSRSRRWCAQGGARPTRRAISSSSTRTPAAGTCCVTPQVDREGARRRREAEPDGRLRDGRGRRGAGRPRAAGREGDAHRLRGARVGRPVEVRRDDDRRARLRAPRSICAPTTSGCSTTPRPAARSSSTTTSSSSTTRSTRRCPARSGASASPTRTPRCGCCSRKHPVFNTPNAIGRADWMGWVQERGLYFFDTADARSAGAGPARVRRSPSPTTRAPSVARWSRRRSGRAAGSTSGWACGGSCRPAPTARSG